MLVSDTIGFIRNLPTKLVASFKTTLDEALEASLILHVVDAADPACERHIATTSGVLAEIGAGEVPQIYVFNKIDKLPGQTLPAELAERFPQHISGLSARPRRCRPAATRRSSIFDHGGPHGGGAARALRPLAAARDRIYQSARVLSEKYDEAGTRFLVRIDPIQLQQLARKCRSSQAKGVKLAYGYEKGTEIKPAAGKLGVLLPGLRAVATTVIAGVEAARRGLTRPSARSPSLAPYALASAQENRTPKITEFVPSPLSDLEFGAWDIFPDDAYRSRRACRGAQP